MYFQDIAKMITYWNGFGGLTGRITEIWVRGIIIFTETSGFTDSAAYIWSTRMVVDWPRLYSGLTNAMTVNFRESGSLDMNFLTTSAES